MSNIDLFSYGVMTPALAFVMSVLGSLIGLLMAARARSVGSVSRLWWLAGAAFAIGGTGVWVMHFVAMLGVKVTGTPIRYDVGLTILSAGVAILAVGAGLASVFLGRGPAALVGGGLVAGLGVAGMQQLGFAAMNMSAEVSHNPVILGISVLIAVAAATMALRSALRVRGALATLGAALVVGLALTVMHYVGMFSMSVEPLENRVPLTGAQVDFLLPLMVGVGLLTIGLLLAVFLSPSSHELREEAELEAMIESRRSRNSDWLN
ncbi:MHYT domain-containing protein [Microtetraspora sp. NBRC 16547]|uniref:MHYT domain-containing protein n=1 Tax=Microtetraspora sp. NBRC 16547 TaxID=3030993 RepID=UPI0024A1D09C|nr:MHYT domain-containing protein [Microtetraspora sp. NBRC 16547]GLX02828.1 membrane protein [Microtetraspora sp. NBRC 16547]